MAQGKIRIRLKGYDHQQLDRSAQQIVDTAQRSGATITGPVPLPTEKNVYCVIRSPFKDKDSREHFEAEVYILSKDEGGRHTPFFKGYRPQFYFRTTDVTGACELSEGVEMVMPGDNVKMVVSLIAPIAMDEGLRFAIREGGRTVGAGVVAKVIK